LKRRERETTCRRYGGLASGGSLPSSGLQEDVICRSVGRGEGKTMLGEEGEVETKKRRGSFWGIGKAGGGLQEERKK